MAWLSCLWLLAITGGGAEPARPSPEAICVPSMLLRLIEQVDVPAQQPGVLARVSAVEGALVAEGGLLAEIDDSEARLALARAQIEWEMARASAENDVRVRFARKAVEVAAAELRRSADSNRKYAKSISESEMDRLRLLVEKDSLEVEQAEYEARLAAFNRRVKENDYRAAQEKVKQHRIAAPLSGIVVHVYRHRGEWVKPGEPVIRILRLDRLRAEGFLKTEHGTEGIEGRAVRLWVDSPPNRSRNDPLRLSPPEEIQSPDGAAIGVKGPVAEYPGKIVFVDPEIDPVNAQIRIWAEVENRGLRLRPGMRATMIVEPPASHQPAPRQR
jgi:macrolide-specific efflux system membrane fusion protein